MKCIHQLQGIDEFCRGREGEKYDLDMFKGASTLILSPLKEGNIATGQEFCTAIIFYIFLFALFNFSRKF